MANTSNTKHKYALIYLAAFTAWNKSIWLGQQFDGSGQKQLLKTRIAEHKRAVAMFDHDSKTSCHIYQNNHQIDF